jgi:hypothetical protein
MAVEAGDPGDRDDELLRTAREAPEGDMRAFEELIHPGTTDQGESLPESRHHVI